MQKYLLVIFTLLIAMSSFSQDVSEEESLTDKKNADLDLPNWQITFSPSAIMNIHPGIQLGVERKLMDKLGLELEGAFLVPIRSTEQRFNEPLNEKLRQGFRSKLGIKYQFNGRDNINLIFFYRKIYFDEVERFLRLNGVFVQRIRLTKVKRLIGPTLGCTTNFRLGEHLLEIGGSMGIGSYKVTFKDAEIPEDASLINNTIFGNYENEGVYNFPIISIQVKYKFGL